MTFESARSFLTLLLMALLSWAVWDYKAQLETVRSERDQALVDLDAVIQVANANAERLAQAKDLDKKHTQELSNARDTNDALRRAVDDRDKRLLVKATCATHVPAVTGTAGVADGATAELAADARSDYFTLRDQLAVSKQMILGLQDHVRSFCSTQTANTGTAP
ncbi:lysis system i-spanin subunit Rz [Pseudomonas putida]|uniref:lysis system i-spanin subunit Rz n=1 Tax=Pseudomonas putida TaxID=303 RepID=UPI003905BC9E